MTNLSIPTESWSTNQVMSGLEEPRLILSLDWIRGPEKRCDTFFQRSTPACSERKRITSRVRQAWFSVKYTEQKSQSCNLLSRHVALPLSSRVAMKILSL